MSPTYTATGLAIALGLPLLDVCLGEDRNNPPEAVVSQIDADPH